MQGHPFVIRLTLLISLSLLMMIGAQAQNVQAHVRGVKGAVQILLNSKSAPQPLKLNTRLEPENIIKTYNDSSAVIGLSDHSRIIVLSNSKVILKNFQGPLTARELLDIEYGRVMVKIKHPPGKPNPYSLSSPAASIAVRGTEFIVDVLRGGETLVHVQEGLVEVWPRDNPDNRRLVSPGDKVTIQPGGRISSIFPAPRRTLETVRQNSNDVSNLFFSAFPDQYLDSLDNPAYATQFKDAQGRLILLPSVSPRYNFEAKNGISNPDSPPQFDYDVSPQVTFFTPIPNSRFVVGGGVFAFRTRNLGKSNVEYADYLSNSNEVKKLNALNASFIAAYSFGDQGKTSVGLGIDRLSGDEERTAVYNIDNKAFNRNTFDYLSAHIASTRLTLGLTRRLSGSMKVGLYYRHGFNLSDQVNLLQVKHDDEADSSRSFYGVGIAKISDSSSSSELGVRFRGSLTRRLFYGAQASYLYERVRSGRETTNQSIAYTRYLKRRANLGVGFGFFLTSKLLLNFDLAGRFNHDGVFTGGPPLLRLNSGVLASFSTIVDNQRTGSAYAHMSAQATPWRNLILSTSILKSYEQDFYTIRYIGDSYINRYSYSSKAYSIGLGWKFTPNLITEYVTSYQYGNRGASHAIRLRYTFNLDITNEK